MLRWSPYSYLCVPIAPFIIIMVSHTSPANCFYFARSGQVWLLLLKSFVYLRPHIVKPFINWYPQWANRASFKTHCIQYNGFQVLRLWKKHDQPRLPMVLWEHSLVDTIISVWGGGNLFFFLDEKRGFRLLFIVAPPPVVPVYEHHSQLKWKSFQKQLRAFVNTAWKRNGAGTGWLFPPFASVKSCFGHLLFFKAGKRCKVHPEHIMCSRRGPWGLHSTSWCTILYQSWGTLTYKHETRSHCHGHIA